MQLQRPYNQVQYRLLGDAGVLVYFMIDEENGDVSLKKSLMDDPNKREDYTVCCNTCYFVIASHSKLLRCKF